MLRKNRAAQPSRESSRVISATGPAARSLRPETKPQTITHPRPAPTAAPQPKSQPRAARTLDARGGTGPRRTAASRLPSGRTSTLVGGGVAGVVLLGWGVTAAVGAMSSPEEDWSSNLSEAVSMSPTSIAAASCESGPGDTGSGPGVITAFEHAYYAQRSGAAARAVVAPDSNLSQASGIQAGIDTIPIGTTHCVAVSEIGPGEYSATITEKRPSGDTRTYKQRVGTVTGPDGRVLIKRISEVGE